VAGQPVDLGQYCEQLERRVGKAHEVMHLMIHKAKDCTRLVFTEKRAGRGKSERGDRHDRLMSDDDRPISSLDRLLGTEIDSNLLAVTKQPRLAGGSVWRSSRPKNGQHILVPVPVPSLPRRLRWRLWHRAGPVALRQHLTLSHDLAADLGSALLSGVAERWVFFFVRPQTPCQIHTSRAKT
jgi:hypothetical protein